MADRHEAERAVLGAILLDNTAWDRIDLEAREFAEESHRRIFSAIAELITDRQPADVLTVSERLGDDQALATVADIAQSVPTAANVVAYSRIVRQEYYRRSVMGLCAEVSAEAEAGENPQALIDDLQTRATEIIIADSQVRTVREMLAVHLEVIDQRFHGGRQGLPTGLDDLDRHLLGLHAGDLVILAGRPGMGKSTIAQGIARTVARHAPVLVINAEMSDEQQSDRLLSAESGVPLESLRSGKIDDADWPRITAATVALKDAPLHFDARSAPTITHIQRQARKIRRMHGLGLVVVDYLQLLSAPSAENRTQEISKLSAALKALAKDLKCPVLALSQLNRSLESRPDKRPRMSDLRESGAIEQDADVILFAYRDEVYNEDSPDRGTAEIIIAKHRQGGIGKVRVAWRGEVCRVENLAHGWEPTVVEQPQKRRSFAARYGQ